ncbi:uncharacterized protein LOC107787269 [Nicotiana tabacum]|uniref:Uncharacterized protein LOC107787269 n=2 Tax=Nicotiana TaxID=4085 RepID=A0A1S3ZIK3_TOBAC|nr:PREDICTED: uncharacterized protein LOC104213082 [Nicotiana sylvestris]XP_016464305.1 PREDICTED: uncharacterized protein LOC107787269 [Nicotiana tabacum]
MSLVDYASSDEEEEDLKEDKQLPKAEEPTPSSAPLDPLPTRNQNPHLPQPQNQRTSSSLNKEALHLSSSSESSELKLPDASVLLNSPSMPVGYMTDHSSRVAAAMAENASRKRDKNVSASTYPRSKIPKGTLPHMKNVPETGSGLLVPPQLAGRSNVVTEDISKLFVKKTPS